MIDTDQTSLQPLPLPVLEPADHPELDLLTDNALAERLGVRVAFSGRAGGVSEGEGGAFRSLNLGAHVDDDPACVAENRRRLVEAFRCDEALRTVVPTQVHGTDVVLVEASDEEEAIARAEAAADGVAVAPEVDDAAVLLCFADCVPLIVVSPSGAYAVVHAGWRGAYGGIAGDAVRVLAEADVARGFFPNVAAAAATYNVYRGPYIHAECFETGEDVRERFVERYGAACAPDDRHVDLGAALDADLRHAGVTAERIADAELCTVCHNERCFSYRAQKGACGRHGALALRERPVGFQSSRRMTDGKRR